MRKSLLSLLFFAPLLQSCTGTGGTPTPAGSTSAPSSTAPIASSAPPAPVVVTPPAPPSPPPPPAAKMGIVVPAYFYDAGLWAELATAATTVPLVAVANPNSGPGAAADPNYTSWIAGVESAGGTVIGYVHTSYGARPLAEVESDVDLWFSLYPSIEGIFFDEQANTAGVESYYLTLYAYTQGKRASSLVVTNPGTNTLPTYLVLNGQPDASMISIDEVAYPRFLSFVPASWTGGYPASDFLGISYGVPAADMASHVDLAQKLGMNYVFFTDLGGGNPYGGLPSYWSALVSYVSQK